MSDPNDVEELLSGAVFGGAPTEPGGTADRRPQRPHRRPGLLRDGGRGQRLPAAHHPRHRDLPVLASRPRLQANTANFWTTKVWFPDSVPSVFGIAALAWGTLLSSVLALVLRSPSSVGIALFIAHYAPRRMASSLGYAVDLLAAVPSVIYGLWGVAYLVPHMLGLSKWLADHLGWIPLFATPGGSSFRQTMFNTGVVLAVMIIPIISAVSREVFLQVPRDHIEAALALGATRWETMRIAVLPFGRSGVISASMLGLGRALGETVAVALILSTNYEISLHILAARAATPSPRTSRCSTASPTRSA